MGLEVFWRESAPVEGHTFAGGCYGGKGGFAVMMRAPSPLSFFFEVSGCMYITVSSSSVRSFVRSSIALGSTGVAHSLVSGGAPTHTHCFGCF